MTNNGSIGDEMLFEISELERDGIDITVNVDRIFDTNMRSDGSLSNIKGSLRSLAKYHASL